MKKLAPALAALAVCATAMPAEAIQFSSSSTTGQGGIILPFRVATPNIGPIGLELNGRLVPGLSGFLGGAGLSPGLNEISSTLVDASVNVSYHHRLSMLEVLPGFSPVIAPFVGARYMGVPTTEGGLSTSGAGAAVSYSQLGGLNYGVRAYTGLPAGFNAFAHLGLTTLTSGGWDVRRNGTAVTSAGKLAVGGTTIPTYGVGLGWDLFNVVALSVGYEGFGLPTGLRTQGNRLTGGQTMINSLSVGVRVLFLSF